MRKQHLQYCKAGGPLPQGMQEGTFMRAGCASCLPGHGNINKEKRSSHDVMGTRTTEYAGSGTCQGRHVDVVYCCGMHRR